MFVDEKAVGEPQPVKLGTLKLSTAIRIGAGLRPQCFHRPFKDGGSCALGAAFEAVEGRTTESDGIVYGFALERLGNKLTDEVWRMNDSDRIPREQIADWLESQGY